MLVQQVDPPRHTAAGQFVTAGSFTGPEQLVAGRKTALQHILLFKGPAQKLCGFPARCHAAQNRPALGMLCKFRIRRPFPVELSVPIPAQVLNPVCDTFLPLPVFLCHPRPSGNLTDFGAVQKRLPVHQVDDSRRAVSRGSGASLGVMPVFLPVHEIPVSQMFHQPLGADMPVVIFQYRIHIRTVLPEQRSVSRALIILQQHKNIVERERADDLLRIGRGMPLDQPHGQHGIMKIQERLSGQRGIPAACIGKQRLQPGIHRILHLLPEGAVHVGVRHTALKRSDAHGIDFFDPWGAGTDIRFRPQRISGRKIPGAAKHKRLPTGPNLHLEEPHGTVPERLIDHIRSAGNDRIFLSVLPDLSVLVIVPSDLVPALRKLLEICKCNFRSCSPGYVISEISIK